ncbi:MAG: lipoprotein [Bacillota bacterium]|nr:lipoprotein [Bacillota bacterium]
MKKIIIVLLIAIVFTGCQSSNTIGSNAKGSNTKENLSQTAVNSSKDKTSSKNAGASNDKRDNTQYKFQSIKPGTVPRINQTQKTQINNNLVKAMSNVDGSLKSLDDIKDVNLDSAN